MGCTEVDLDLDLRTLDLLEACSVVGNMLLVVILVMIDDLDGNERQDDSEGDADEECEWEQLMVMGNDESRAEASMAQDVTAEFEDVVKVVKGTEELAMDVLIVVGLIEHEILDDWHDETDVMKWLFAGGLLVPTRQGEMDELVDDGRLGEMAMIEE